MLMPFYLISRLHNFVHNHNINNHNINNKVAVLNTNSITHKQNISTNKLHARPS